MNERERKRRIDNARRKRQAAEREERRRERLRSLAVKLGVAVLTALVVVGAVIAFSNSGSGSSEDVNQMFEGLEQHGIVLGDPKAEVTITEFADLQCPACRAFALNELSDVIDEVVRPGKANLAIRQFPILGPDSHLAATAAMYAAEQGRYHQFVEFFYRNQGTENTGYVNDEFLARMFELAGVNPSGWERYRKAEAADEVIKETLREARRHGFNSTPSILVEGPKGSKVAEPTAKAVATAAEGVS